MVGEDCLDPGRSPVQGARVQQPAHFCGKRVQRGVGGDPHCLQTRAQTVNELMDSGCMSQAQIACKSQSSPSGAALQLSELPVRT